jgi:hypothetical protein
VYLLIHLSDQSTELSMHKVSNTLRNLVLVHLVMCTALYAQSLDEVLERYYQTMGGKDLIGSIESLKIKGHVNYMGTEFPFLILVKDKKARMEYHLDGGTVIRVFDGKKGWEINTMVHNSKPQPLTCHDSAFMKELAEGTCPLYEWKAKGHKVKLEGSVEENGKQLVKIDLKSKHGQQIQFFLNPSDMQPVFAKRIEGEGQDYRIVYKSFHRSSEGMLFPKQLKVGEKLITYTEQLINVAIEDRLFQAEGATPQLGVNAP